MTSMEPHEVDPLDRLVAAIDLHDALRSLPEAEVRGRLEQVDPALRERVLLLQSESAKSDPEVRRLGGHRLLRELGRGGMGVVYEAEDEALFRRVALKVLAPWGGGSETAIRRFRREARAIARLDHPNIVRVHGVSECEGIHFLVMELCSGVSLAQWLAENPPPEGREDRATFQRFLLRGLAGVARALEHAHGHGILHRDVKPQNILVRPDGTMRLIDFGLAREVGALTLTGNQGVPGTPHYMSPEQIVGEGAELDGRTDVFSLGVVLYECLTGRRPFRGERVESVLAAVRAGSFPPVRKVQPHVPADLARWCERCLERDPALRVSSAGKLAEALERFGEGLPTRIGTLPLSTRVRRWLTRRSRMALGASLLAGTLGFGWLGSWKEVAAAPPREDVESAKSFFEFARQRSVDLLAVLERSLQREPQAASFYEEKAERLVSEVEALVASRPDDLSRHFHAAEVHRRVGVIRLECLDFDGAQASFARAERHLALLSRGKELTCVVRLESTRLALERAKFDLYRGNVSGAAAAYERAKDELAVLEGAELVDVPSSLRRLEVELALEQGAFEFHVHGDHGAASRSLARGRLALEKLDGEVEGSWVALMRTRFALLSVEIEFGCRRMENVRIGLQEARRALPALTSDRQAREVHGLLAKVEGCIHHRGSTISLAANERAVDLFSPLVEEYPGYRRYRAELAMSLDQWGLARFAAGEKAEALELLERAFEHAEDLLEGRSTHREYPWIAATIANHLASVAMTCPEGEEVPLEELFQRSRSWHEELLTIHPDRPSVLSSLGAVESNHAQWLVTRDRFEEAEAQLWRAIDHQAKALVAVPGNKGYASMLHQHFAILRQRVAAEPEARHDVLERLSRMAAADAPCPPLLAEIENFRSELTNRVARNLPR